MTTVRSFAQLSAEDTQIQEHSLEVPEPTGHEVVVDISHAGVCHTDIHVRDGGYDLGSAGWMSMTDRGVQHPLVDGPRDRRDHQRRRTGRHGPQGG